MNLLVWLILVASVNSNPAPEARRPRQASRSSRTNRRELSDEDILKAVLELEHLRLREAGAGGAVHGEHPQGDHHEANGQDEGVDGVLEVPYQTLSPRVLKSIPGRIQRCKEGEEGQEAHGQDHLPAGGGQHHGDDQEEGADQDQEVERGVPGSPTSPPSPRMTPDKAGPRVICTPLWKRKSQQKRSSSFQSKKTVKRTGSMLRSPTSPPTSTTTSTIKQGDIF